MKNTKFNELIDAIKQNIRNVILLFCGFGALVAILASQICIVETTSNSIPYSWCLQVYNLNPKKDEASVAPVLCAFNFRGRRFIKYLVGTAGDEIKHIGRVVYVGLTRVGAAKKTDHLSQIPEGKIPEGYVFMAGTHEDSLDSRYKEFGLIPVSDIRGKALGLLKYKDER